MKYHGDNMSHHERSVKPPDTNTKQSFHEEDNFDNQTNFAAIQHIVKNPDSKVLARSTILQLQSTIGNRAVQRLLNTPQPIKTKSAPTGSIQLGQEVSRGEHRIRIYSAADAPANSVNVATGVLTAATKAEHAGKTAAIRFVTAFIERAQNLVGNPPIINCQHGRERSPTVAALYLILKGATGDEAIAALTNPAVVAPGAGQVISIEFVTGWINKIKAFKDDLPARPAQFPINEWDTFITAITAIPDTI